MPRQYFTLLKGFFESRSSAAFQVSRRALSSATAISASLNWNRSATCFMFYPAEVRPELPAGFLQLVLRLVTDWRGILSWPRRPTSKTASYLYRLQLADGGAKCNAFLRIVGSTVHCGLGNAERLRCNSDSSAVQGLLKRSHTRNRDLKLFRVNAAF